VQLIRLYLVEDLVRSIRLLDQIDRILGLVRIEMERVLLTLMFLRVFWVLRGMIALLQVVILLGYDLGVPDL